MANLRSLGLCSERTDHCFIATEAMARGRIFTWALTKAQFHASTFAGSRFAWNDQLSKSVLEGAMHLGRFGWIALLLLFILMVLCGASGCSWERVTDTRGLSRHRASCHFYRKSSTLAAKKRQERAREAVFSNLAPKLSTNMSHVSNSTSFYSTHASLNFRELAVRDQLPLVDC